MQGNLVFSIVIPTYNRGTLLIKTIESFLQQRYPYFELLIVDDGSTDNTEEILKRVTDERIKYFKKLNGERGAARNYGAARATGSYINFFDSDDLAYPNHLQAAFETVQKHNYPELFHLGFDIKTPEGKILSVHNEFNGRIEDYAIKTKKISINALFIKKEIAQNILFSENRLLSASEDAAYLCRLCARYSLIFNSIITTTIVEHDNRSMAVASESQLLNRRKYLIEELQNDPVFMERFGKYLKDIYSESSYLLVLSCLASKQRKKARSYFREYIDGQPVKLLDFRALVFLKKYINSLF